MHRRIQNYLNYFIGTGWSSLVSDSIHSLCKSTEVFRFSKVHQSKPCGHWVISVATTLLPNDEMSFLGDKIASTIIAQSANVPTLPWSGSRKPRRKSEISYLPTLCRSEAALERRRSRKHYCAHDYLRTGVRERSYPRIRGRIMPIFARFPRKWSLFDD